MLLFVLHDRFPLYVILRSVVTENLVPGTMTHPSKERYAWVATHTQYHLSEISKLMRDSPSGIILPQLYRASVRRGPKIALPTRTIVAPSSIAIS